MHLSGTSSQSIVERNDLGTPRSKRTVLALAWCVISKMYLCHRKAPGVSERMWSVNLDASIAGEYETLGGHSCWPSDYLGVPVTSLGAPTTSLGAPGSTGDKPGSAGDKSGRASNHCRAVWEKQHLLWQCCWCAPGNHSYYLLFNDF